MMIDLKPGDRYFIVEKFLYRLRANELCYLYKDGAYASWDKSNCTIESFLQDGSIEIPASEVVLLDLEEFSF